MMRVFDHAPGWLCYSSVFLIVLIATALRAWLFTNAGVKFAFVTFYPAVMLAALYGGFRPGLLAAVLSGLIAILFMEPIGSIPIINYSDWVGLMIFLGTTALLSYIVDSRNKAILSFRECDERFRTLADNMSQFAWMADGKGSIFWYNKRWYDYTGTALEEMRGWGWKKVHHPDHVDRVVEKIQCSWDTGRPWEDVFPLRGKDGQYRWFLSRALPIRDEGGHIVRWFGTNTDITELRIQMGKVEESNRALQDFAFVASHDLQEPLRKIQSFGKLLWEVDASALGERGQDYLKRIIGASERMQMLIQSLLAYSRVSTSGEPFSQVDLNNVVESVLEDLEQRIEQTQGSVTVEKLPAVEADSSQMRQLFQNLIGNALKFNGGKKPVIMVYTPSCSSGVCEIRVEDNGIGFDEMHLSTIFKPFQRLHGRSAYEGTGMGLAICKRIVERHHGEITAKSKQGEGSTFIVKLPLNQ